MHEFSVLQQVFRHNTRLPSHVTVPPGDDMAEIQLGSSSRLLVAVDSVVEGRHTPMGIDPFVIGRKAVLRNVSDVAAMVNAGPIASVVAAVLPPGVSDSQAWRLHEGIRAAAEFWGAPVIGGDIATREDALGISVSLTILAIPIDPARPVATRAAARVGDGVYVTGVIGGAWDPVTKLGRHLDFTPRLAVAHELLRRAGDQLGAVIDVSDGLGRDLGHIARMSGVTIELELGAVPLGPGVDPRQALGSGEDYELAFTARGSIPSAAAGVSITRIGTVVAGHGEVRAHGDGAWFDASGAGFEHDGGDGA
jgi:thiamine-monophosphate kinase